MMGMKSYSVLYLNRFKFTTTISSTTSVSNSNNYQKLSFMYWSFKLRVCPVGYPYFDAPSLLCYDACLPGKYADPVTLQCLACKYTCKTCSSYSVCTDCDPVTFRYLNGTSCLPNSGYF